jgi:acetyl esterase
MPLDPQARAVLDLRAAQGFPPPHQTTPEQARANLRARIVVPPGGPEPVAAVEERAVPGPDGPVPVRVYTPITGGLVPALVFFHGGGWMIGDLDTHDGICRALANRAGCVVISVDYRRAPEHPFPAAPDDCYAATAWVAEHARSLGADAARLAVGGDSAGGNLAAAVALMARDRGGPPLRYQLLVYPVVERDFSTKSYQENADGYGLSRADMEWFWRQYLRADADAANPYAAPIKAASLAGLPPALVVTAGYDVLRDEAESFATRLAAAGVAVEVARYPTLIHGFFGMAGMVDEARHAVDAAAASLCAALA